jgi:hypothetical protein
MTRLSGRSGQRKSSAKAALRAHSNGIAPMIEDSVSTCPAAQG